MANNIATLFTNLAKVWNYSISNLTLHDISKKKLIGSVTLSVFVLMSILVSFGTSNRKDLSYSYLVWFVVGYTISAAVCFSIIVYLFSIFVKKQWTPVKHFMLTFITTSAIWVCDSTYYFFCLNINNFSFSKSLHVHFLVTFLIGVLFGVMGYLWIKNKHLDSGFREKEEQSIERQISSSKENSDQKLITLYGNSQKNTLTIFPDDILYIESTSNYVYFFYIIDNKLWQKKLRTTLSKMEETLNDYPFLVRCHRAFIVNTHQIRKINRSKIWLNSIEIEIPVSRTYKINIQKQIDSIDRLSPI